MGSRCEVIWFGACPGSQQTVKVFVDFIEQVQVISLRDDPFVEAHLPIEIGVKLAVLRRQVNRHPFLVSGTKRRGRRILCAVAVTMLSIMKPVFGQPVGTGVTSTGGMAIQTPTEKMFW